MTVLATVSVQPARPGLSLYMIAQGAELARHLVNLAYLVHVGQLTPVQALHARDTTVLQWLAETCPEHRCYRELTAGRARFVGRSLAFGARPHTVITADVEELASAMAPGVSIRFSL